MTRNEFIAKFEVLKEHNDKSIAIGEALCCDLLDGYPIVKFGGELEASYIELLASQSDISEDAISALLYEGPSMHYYGNKIGSHYDVELNVVTAEDLWDFYQLCDEYDQNKRGFDVLLYDNGAK